MVAESPVDPGGLAEFSVVFTGRALNHMSRNFQQVMRDISALMRSVYQADAVAVVPGGGSYGMEAIARQFAQDARVLVIRNGWFSYRWSQIFAMGRIVAHETVLKARRVSDAPQSPFAPPPIEEVEAAIARDKPELVFAAHVETASGIILPDDYLDRVGAAVHAHGGLFVLDCVASGAIWVDMRARGIDVLLSAPQKTWSAPSSSALVMLGARAAHRLEQTQSTSFAADLRKWRQIMQAYENGSHAYHATMPTDALRHFRDAAQQTVSLGLDHLRERQEMLGRKVRTLLVEHGYPSVAASGFEAPGVVVSYTRDPDLASAKRFVELGIQAAAGVPLMCDEPADFRSFRIGLFGLDKFADVDATVERLAQALRALAGSGAR
ncbi:aminotransferase class V-fold PLP-dependent enzyme [Sinimarinibacterium thermocellulolyticum]|uniref:aminotransferase class V-fold PLP-dependent enzyme n=1 Tax=Sinimarinibacterium thermocellulolyticum TaxID=3170016 RepID=UPI003D9FF5B7